VRSPGPERHPIAHLRLDLYDIKPSALARVACRIRPAQSRLGLIDVATSVVPTGAVVLLYLTLGTSILLTVALMILAAGFLVRVFVVFHDCTHGSLLPTRRANAWVGAVLGLFVLSPFRRWQHEPCGSPRHVGDLDRRGVGDIVTLTIPEYYARCRAPAWPTGWCVVRWSCSGSGQCSR